MMACILMHAGYAAQGRARGSGSAPARKRPHASLCSLQPVKSQTCVRLAASRCVPAVRCGFRVQPILLFTLFGAESRIQPALYSECIMNVSMMPTPTVCQAHERHAAQLRAQAEPAKPHPLVLKYAQSHGLANLPDLHQLGGGRLASLANSSRLWHLTHIAKTGGRAVQKELSRIAGRVAGAEQCMQPFRHPSRINVIFFREPRAHVLSQYMHGATVGRNRRDITRSDRKWQRRNASGYPMGLDAAGLSGGFAAWVAHFARAWTPSRGDFFSYNPLNMQSRSLTCRDERKHSRQRLGPNPKPLDCTGLALRLSAPVSPLTVPPRSPPVNILLYPMRCARVWTDWNVDFVTSCEVPCSHHVGPNASDASPSLAAALAALHSAHFVGILELLPESLCVFEHRVKGAASANCARQRRVVRNPGQAHDASRRPTLTALPVELMREVDAITTVDRQVYAAAIIRVLCDVAALERETGRTILTPARRAALRHATAHIDGLWTASAS